VTSDPGTPRPLERVDLGLAVSEEMVRRKTIDAAAMQGP
jgi:hypothetical protein